MSSHFSWWLSAILAAALIYGWVKPMLAARQSKRPAPLPTEWGITPRPVFSTDERRVYRMLREALPHHIILSKLPLVRFCQPIQPNDVRFWFDLLGGVNVTFAICSANGRVLAAIDLDSDRSASRRVLQIKHSVLGACRVRYLRTSIDALPSIAELQMLVPPVVVPRAPDTATPPPRDLHIARDNLATTVATRRAERSALWQDSMLYQDSFFVPDNRIDTLSRSEFGALTTLGRSAQADDSTPSTFGRIRPYRSSSTAGDDLGGIVVESSSFDS